MAPLCKPGFPGLRKRIWSVSDWKTPRRYICERISPKAGVENDVGAYPQALSWVVPPAPRRQTVKTDTWSIDDREQNVSVWSVQSKD